VLPQRLLVILDLIKDIELIIMRIRKDCSTRLRKVVAPRGRGRPLLIVAWRTEPGGTAPEKSAADFGGMHRVLINEGRTSFLRRLADELPTAAE
jgi:hypothetical protein